MWVLRLRCAAAGPPATIANCIPSASGSRGSTPPPGDSLTDPPHQHAAHAGFHRDPRPGGRRATRSWITDAGRGTRPVVHARDGGTCRAERRVTYTWSPLRPGTYLYQSGTHPSIQVPMGLLRGAGRRSGDGRRVPGGQQPPTTTSTAATTPTPCCSSARSTRCRTSAWRRRGGVPTAACVRWPTTSHDDGYPCTIDYNPTYFLVNGEPYTDHAAGR